MVVLALYTAFGSPPGLGGCLDGSHHSALVFCQELSPEHQRELAARYRSEPTDRIAMLLGMQQQPAVDLAPLVRDEPDAARWYWLVGGNVEATGPTPDGRLRRWARAPVTELAFVVEVLDHRDLRIPQRRWKRLANHPDAGVRSLAVGRLTSVGVDEVAGGLAREPEAVVQSAWARHAFDLEDEPTSLRSALAEVEAWQRLALDAVSPWADRWLAEELMTSPSPAWLIRRLADEPPPELWTRCAALLDAPRVTSLDALDQRAAQSACVHAWRVRTGRDALTYDEAVVLAGQTSP